MTDFTDSSTITLPDFIRTQQKGHPKASGEFSGVLLSIALGTKIVSRGVNMAGLAALLGLTGETNVQGERVQKLDVYADNVFTSVLSRCDELVSMVSEEQEFLYPSPQAGDNSHYVIAFDPLDGSSNIDVNVAIGTIWGIYRRRPKPALGQKVDIDLRNDQRAQGAEYDFLQAGREQVAAGYAVYGSSTMFVYATEHGVNGFTLDPNIGEYILTHPQMTLPHQGNIYSCNEGNYDDWPEGVRMFVDSLKRDSADGTSKRCSARYVGSLVADFHRTMLKGGIFLYPADNKNTSGKLRLLYECSPLAYIAEKAGGSASTGFQPILDIIPSSIHQRSPLFLGSKYLVDAVQSSMLQARK